MRRAADDAVRATPTPGRGNSRLSQPLVRDSLGRLRPSAVNDTGAAGGDQRGAKMAINKAVARVSR